MREAEVMGEGQQKGIPVIGFGQLGRSLRIVSMAAARKALRDLPGLVQAGPVLIMKSGHPVMAVLSTDHFEGMLETIEILSDQTFCRRLRESIEQARAGRTKSLDGG
jgi:PHD/YefM family antitoxin component YafN of YafNO toxin-antitoxin module